MVKILYDERNHTDVRRCEHCGEEKEGRRIQVGGTMFSKMEESRGYYFICFDCFGARVKWTHYSKGAIWSPVGMSEEGRDTDE